MEGSSRRAQPWEVALGDAGALSSRDTDRQKNVEITPVQVPLYLLLLSKPCLGHCCACRCVCVFNGTLLSLRYILRGRKLCEDVTSCLKSVHLHYLQAAAYMFPGGHFRHIRPGGRFGTLR